MTTLSTPAGKPGLLEAPGQVEPGQRGVLRQLHHDRVAVGQRRGALPGRDRGGEVPRGDQPDHAERPAPDVDGGAGRGLLEHLADRPPALAGEEAEDLRRAACLEARLAQGLAHLAGHVLRDVLDAGLDRLRGARQDRAALDRGQRRPARPGLGGGTDGMVDVLLGRAGELAEHLRGPPRVVALVRPASAAGDPLPPDEVGRAGRCDRVRHCREAPVVAVPAPARLALRSMSRVTPRTAPGSPRRVRTPRRAPLARWPPRSGSHRAVGARR